METRKVFCEDEYVTYFFLDLVSEQRKNESNLLYRIEEDWHNEDKNVFYLRKVDGSEEVLTRDAYFMFARKRVHDSFPKETEYGAQIKWIVDGIFDSHITMLLSRMEPTELTEEQISGLRNLIGSCLEDIHELPNGRERPINIKTIYHMTRTNYHMKRIIKEIMLDFEYRFMDNVRKDEISTRKDIFYHIEFYDKESTQEIYDQTIEPEDVEA